MLCDLNHLACSLLLSIRHHADHLACGEAKIITK